FVKLDDIDPMWYDRPYFLEPQRGGEKSYVLLRQAMEQTGFGGLSKTVLRNREHLGIVIPHGPMLLLQLLRFSDEVRDAAKLDVPDDVKIEKKQLDLAKELINKMAEEFRFEDYVDEYSAKLLEVVRKKARGKRVTVPKAPKAPPVKDLMDALKKSLKAA
ncbi:MAG TPA: Ku protein, partial [Planctomycetota bacterium]|nr:Ku protein [Planctomycetota bacterium]